MAMTTRSSIKVNPCPAFTVQEEVGLRGAQTSVQTVSPDVALVQIVVDILALVIMVLALSRLPRSRRRMAKRSGYAFVSHIIQRDYTRIVERKLHRACRLLHSHTSGYRTVNFVG